MESTGFRPFLVAFHILTFSFYLTQCQRTVQIPPPRPLCASQYALANYACSRLPINPILPPTPLTPPPPTPIAPPPPDDDDDREHGSHHGSHGSHGSHSSHGHRHRHHHHHHRQHKETYSESECCKWLKQMDNECVCDLLYHLPPLLAKPTHDYTLYVDENCVVVFTCGGRIR